MDIDPQEASKAWWKGAFTSALKGIPQGLLLGVIGFGMLAGGIYLFGATSLVGSFGSFLFGSTSAASAAVASGSFSAFVGSLNPATFLVLNTVLTVVGNFLTGGQIAVNAYKQDAEHRQNEARLDAIEGREIALEQCVNPSRTVQKILAAGPRQRDSFAAAEEQRDTAPAQPTIH